MKKYHHDHVTAAGQGLATTANVNNHMSVSQTEADEGRVDEQFVSWFINTYHPLSTHPRISPNTHLSSLTHIHIHRYHLVDGHIHRYECSCLQLTSTHSVDQPVLDVQPA